MSKSSAPRDRLIDTAARLFYRQGLPTVGINAVTDQAGVARMTLYNHFKSKDDLALAAFARQGEQRRERIEAALARRNDAAGKIAALFDLAEALAAEEGFRGCVFINAVLQQLDPDSRLHTLALAHKRWVAETIRHVVEAGGVCSGDRLAQQVLALWDGAIVGAYIQKSADPIRAARDAALTLLSAARAGASA